ncbi:hypothetical protein V8C40DRAFT_270742 [Trichoderma camerunense]
MLSTVTRWTLMTSIVLYVRRSCNQDLKHDPILVKVFRDQFPGQVTDYKLEVEATCALWPNARPSHPIACGMSGQKDANGQWVPIPEEIKFKMAFHRALLRGNGFYDVLVPLADEVYQLADQLANSSLDIGVTNMGELLLPKRLPVIDLIDLPQEHLNSLIEEALPADRQRFVKYLSERPLGFGAIVAQVGTYENYKAYFHIVDVARKKLKPLLELYLKPGCSFPFTDDTFPTSNDDKMVCIENLFDAIND